MSSANLTSITFEQIVFVNSLLGGVFSDAAFGAGGGAAKKRPARRNSMTQNSTGRKSRPTYDELMAIPAVRNVSRWKLPNTDDHNDTDASVRFGKEHRPSFLRFAKAAIALIVSKEDSPL